MRLEVGKRYRTIKNTEVYIVHSVKENNAAYEDGARFEGDNAAVYDEEGKFAIFASPDFDLIEEVPQRRTGSV